MNAIGRKGIVLAGGSGTRLYPLTISVSKQLMPVFDKPMIYYPLSILMLAGIREVLIITTPHDAGAFQNLLGDGSQFGLEISWTVQEKPEGLAQALILADDFLDGAPSALILGDNLFYGGDLSAHLQRVSGEAHSTIFAYKVSNPKDYGVVGFDETGKATSLEEKPAEPVSDYAVPGLYFYETDAPEIAKGLAPSARGELEITDLNRVVLERGSLQVEVLRRGNAWLDTGSPHALLEAARFVEIIQSRQGLKIACLEEIGFRMGWLDRSGLLAQADRLKKTEYGRYLQELADS